VPEEEKAIVPEEEVKAIVPDEDVLEEGGEATGYQ
jgi:hypothetical protein